MLLLDKRFTTCLLALLFFSSQALDLSKVNLSYQYDLSRGFTFEHRVAQTGSTINVYFHLTGDSIQNWEQNFLLQTGYASETHDTLRNFHLDTLSWSGSSIMMKLSIERPQHSLLLLTWSDPQRLLHQIYEVPVKQPGGFPSFIPVTDAGLPILKAYVTSSELSLKGAANYHAYKYRDDFGPADPPMGLMKPIAPMLSIDSSFFFDQTLELTDYHFYLIQSDTLEESGLTLLKCPSYYPEYKLMEELVEPLTYITTPGEIKTLRDQMNKRAFENFWVNTYGTKFRAKGAIRVFYDRIERANTLFTDYKQGWKTDRGMVYLVFGHPDQVVRNDRQEVWSYENGAEFEFIRISTLFAPSLYTLKRDRKYEKLWYSQVGDIRKGI